MLFFLIEDNKTTVMFSIWTPTLKHLRYRTLLYVLSRFHSDSQDSIHFIHSVLFEYSQTELTRFGLFVSLTKILLVKCINLHSGTVFADTTSLVSKLFFSGHRIISATLQHTILQKLPLWLFPL